MHGGAVFFGKYVGSIAAFRFRKLFPLSKSYERRDPVKRDFASFSDIRERRRRIDPLKTEPRRMKKPVLLSKNEYCVLKR